MKNFKSEELDGLIEKWISEKISDAEREFWVLRLKSDAKFRDDFCEWIKTLRSPWPLDSRFTTSDPEGNDV